jgi:hypothetical protein
VSTRGKRPTVEEGFLRNAGFAVADESLDPALRRKMAAALRLELTNQQTAAAEQTRLRAEADAVAAEKARLLAEAAARANPGKGRAPGTKNKKTLRLEALFDRLLRDNPDCAAEDLRHKAAKSVKGMSRATLARHWSDAKKRRLNLTSD